jgi:hypothetical protein
MFQARLTAVSFAIALLAGCGSSSNTDGSSQDAAARDGASLEDSGRPDGGGAPADGGQGRDGGSGGGDAMSMASDAGGPTVELGTGTDHFEPLVEGQKLIFNLGPQGGGRFGGYNIWGGVRATGVMPQGAMLTYTLTSTAGDVLAASMRQTTLIPDGSDFVAYAISVVLNDCCKAAARDLTLRLDFMDAGGVTRSDTRHVRGADQCQPGADGINPCQ